jgi:hypothetical protein
MAPSLTSLLWRGAGAVYLHATLLTTLAVLALGLWSLGDGEAGLCRAEGAPSQQGCCAACMHAAKHEVNVVPLAWTNTQDHSCG